MSRTELLTSDQAFSESMDAIESSEAIKVVEEAIIDAARNKGWLDRRIIFGENPDVRLDDLINYLKLKGYYASVVNSFDSRWEIWVDWS